MKTLDELHDAYGELIKASAEKHGLDPAVLAGLIWQESRGNCKAISVCGAIGLTQVMPATAKCRGYSLLTPARQIDAGADYLSWVLKNFAKGNIEDALGGYNAGPGRIKGGKWRRIKESREYVPHVLAYAEQYRAVLDAKKKT